MTFQTNPSVATLLAAGTLILSLRQRWHKSFAMNGVNAGRYIGTTGTVPSGGFNMHPYHWRWGEERRHGWYEHQGYGYWGGWQGHGRHGDDE